MPKTYQRKKAACPACSPQGDLTIFHKDHGDSVWICQNCGERVAAGKAKTTKTRNNQGLTPAQVATIDAIRSNLLGQSPERYEIKEETVSADPCLRGVYVTFSIEVGLLGDVGTAAELFCRVRGLFQIGDRGGVTVLNLRSGLKDVEERHYSIYLP